MVLAEILTIDFDEAKLKLFFLGKVSDNTCNDDDNDGDVDEDEDGDVIIIVVLAAAMAAVVVFDVVIIFVGRREPSLA